MRKIYTSGPVTLHCGNMLDVLAAMAAESVDSIVTDPPYGLSEPPDMMEVLRAWMNGERYHHGKPGFMGKAWDSFVPGPEMWRECLRVLKPGGHLLAFFGTRTHDVGTLAIRLAGFEVRDCISWMYGTGFPKSHNLAGDWAGWGTALKPATEPIVLARKPLKGTVARNVLTHGTGALNVDGCRIATAETIRATRNTALGCMNDDGWKPQSQVYEQNPSGRWPANVILDEHAAAALDAQSGFRRPGERPARAAVRADASPSIGGSWAGFSGRTREVVDSGGGASRFFYVAKPGRKERAGNTHATVKPLALMRYLVRLVTPPGGLVLDPFAGSGTTLLAARDEGFRAVGVELEREHCAIIRRRLRSNTKRAA